MPAIARVDPKTHATAGRTLTVDPANMLVRAVISTAAPDRAGDVILPAGLRNADEFLRNPSSCGPTSGPCRRSARASG